MTRARLVARSAAFALAVGGCLFAAAGRLDMPAFWVYTFLFAGYLFWSSATMDLSLAQERVRHANRRLFLLLLVAMSHWVVAGLDAGRYHWSPVLPAWLQVCGLAACALAWVIAAWAVRVNTFFSSVIRIQKDRGHHVIDTGPYASIRHPGYASALLNILGSGIALGSLISMIPLIPAVPAVFVRLFAEERTLRAELPGYTEYAARVRRRLLPGIW